MVAARAPAVPQGELEAALVHARSCLSRLCGGQPIAEGPVAVDPEPLPPGHGHVAPGSSPFAALPLLLGRTEVSGVLYVRGARGLREADLAFLSAAADHLSLARDRRFAWEREVRLRERAEALDRKQKDLVAVVSHDLRNPLGAVLIGVSTLRRWPQLDAARVRENLDSIHRAAERASRLVHDLLDVARIDAGHLQLELAPLDLGALAREAVELMKPLLAQAQLTCEAQVAERMSPVLADRERILQVLSNLIGNARKFGRPGSVVSLAVWEEEGEARCCVSDEGPGISGEDLPHIFDRYFQGPHGPTAHGVGLGLSIARGIVEAHGGRIWVDSAPGQGHAVLLQRAAVAALTAGASRGTRAVRIFGHGTVAKLVRQGTANPSFPGSNPGGASTVSARLLSVSSRSCAEGCDVMPSRYGRGMTRKSVEDFFAAYAAAFSRLDVDGIVALWSLPALITTAERSGCFADREAFRRNTEALCAFYRAQGLSRAKKTVVRIHPLGDGVAAVTTRDEVFDARGRRIARWQHAYLIRKTAEGLRSIAAVADGEMRAWNARGTPLGSPQARPRGRRTR